MIFYYFLNIKSLLNSPPPTKSVVGHLFYNLSSTQKLLVHHLNRL